jgi:hypothetical protein
MGIQTSRLVVAHSENGCDVRANVAETLGTIALASAVDSGAAYESGGLPDDLSEVTISIECGLVVDVRWGGLAIETIVVGCLVVVEQLSDDGADVVGWAAGGNVLAVSSTVGRTAKMSGHVVKWQSERAKK